MMNNTSRENVARWRAARLLASRASIITGRSFSYDDGTRRDWHYFHAQRRLTRLASFPFLFSSRTSALILRRFSGAMLTRWYFRRYRWIQRLGVAGFDAVWWHVTPRVPHAHLFSRRHRQYMSCRPPNNTTIHLFTQLDMMGELVFKHKAFTAACHFAASLGPWNTAHIDSEKAASCHASGCARRKIFKALNYNFTIAYHALSVFISSWWRSKRRTIWVIIDCWFSQEVLRLSLGMMLRLYTHCQLAHTCKQLQSNFMKLIFLSLSIFLAAASRRFQRAAARAITAHASSWHYDIATLRYAFPGFLAQISRLCAMDFGLAKRALWRSGRCRCYTLHYISAVIPSRFHSHIARNFPLAALVLSFRCSLAARPWRFHRHRQSFLPMLLSEWHLRGDYYFPVMFFQKLHGHALSSNSPSFELFK